MRPVRPVHLHDKGLAVLILHECLLYLNHNWGSVTDHDRHMLGKRLAPEMRDETFGPATHDLVYLWQDQIRETRAIPANIRSPLPKNGDVDKPTAKALNWLLAELGALRVSGAQPAARRTYRGIPKAVLKRLRVRPGLNR